MRWPHKVAEPKNATIPSFLAAAHAALKPFGVKLGVDLFGLAAAHELGIGQDVALIAKHVDVISPMVYPNHFGPGELGVSDITVKVHRGQVMRKMGAKSLAELVRMAEVLSVRGEASRWS